MVDEVVVVVEDVPDAEGVVVVVAPLVVRYLGRKEPRVGYEGLILLDDWRRAAKGDDDS